MKALPKHPRSAERVPHPHEPAITRAEIEAVIGRATDELVEALIATGGTAADLELARQWLDGADDAMGKTGHRLSGAAAAMYDLLGMDEEPADPER
jgi:hypothetical protein